MGEFTMPSLGADMEAGVLAEWKVRPGDTVKRGDIIAEVETQKGVIEIEVFEDGMVEKILVEPGQEVPVGTVLAIIGSSPAKARKKEEKPVAETPVGQKTAPAPKIEVSEKKAPVPVTPPSPATSTGSIRVRATPLARKMAEELGVNLNNIRGTGEGGIITKEDVKSAPIADADNIEEPEKTPESPTPKAKMEGPVQLQRQSMRAAIAAAMSKSNLEIPHYYLETRVDMKVALEWLEEENKKRPIKDRLLPPALFIKAMAMALADTPHLNGSWIDDAFVPATDINIGMVISLRSGGIVVPAIRSAHTRSLDEIMQDMMDITLRTREGKLRASDINSVTVTLTQLGDRGAQAVWGVIYPPQVAIVGIGRIREEPWAEKGMLDVRPVVTITLAGDHRATDGQTGSRFLEAMNNYLQKPASL